MLLFVVVHSFSECEGVASIILCIQVQGRRRSADDASEHTAQWITTQYLTSQLELSPHAHELQVPTANEDQTRKSVSVWESDLRRRV